MGMRGHAVSEVIAAPATTSTSVGTGVTVGVPILVILILFYLVTHKGHKLSGLILAFVAGVMLSGTQIASSLSQLVEKLVTSGVDAITGVFS